MIAIPAPNAAPLDMMPMEHHGAINKGTDHHNPNPKAGISTRPPSVQQHTSKADSPANNHAHDDQDAVVAHHNPIDAHGEQDRPQHDIRELEREVDLDGQAVARVQDDLGDDEGDGHDGEGDDEAVEAAGRG